MKQKTPKPSDFFNDEGRFVVPDEEVVFTNCNVCGIVLRTDDEEQMGMCERCANDWKPTAEECEGL